MDELDVLARDYGLRPGGKSAPMRSDGGDRRSASARSSAFFDDREGPVFDDVFGGPPKYTNSNTNNKASTMMNNFDYDSIFKSGNDSKKNNSKKSSLPVYDKPVYDDDIFDGMPGGLKSKSVSSSTPRFDDDVFASVASQPKKNHNTDQFDDLLGNFGKNEKVTEAKSSKSSNSRGFDDLLAGFGSGNPASTNRPFTESNQPSKLSGNSNRTSSTMDDPFGVLDTSSAPSPGVFSDPLEGITKPGKSGSAKVDSSSVWGSAFDELDPLNSFGRSVPPFSPERNKKRNNESPTRDRSGKGEKQTSTVRENTESSFRNSQRHPHKTIHGDSFPQSLFDAPATDSQKSFSQDAASSPYPQYASVNSDENSSQVDLTPRSEEQVQASEDIWITVSEVPLVTQPTSAPPPSRPPPPIPRQTAKSGTGFFASHPWRGDDYSSVPSYSEYSESPKTARAASKSSPVSQLDELEEFFVGRTQNSVDGTASALAGEEMNTNSVAAASAAAMKEAMDRAEAKFRRAKEVREREYAKAARTNVQLDKDEQDIHEMQDREFKEDQEKLERERRQRVKEEEEREQRRLERERERARQVVDRATREARERAAAEARERAVADARMKAERAAVEKAAAEARERAERAAVQRAQAEARERAAAEARERANAEAREREVQEKAAAAKAEAEARRRAEKAAVERAAAEARERAAAEARERAAAASRVNQQKNDNDLESFFCMGSRASSAPRPRASSPDTMFDMQFQNKGGSEGAKATSSFSGATSNMRKASSTTNIVDDLSSIFGAAPSSGEFQEVEGESDDRRRARLERHQRTQERAAKALAEKNQRDLQVQRDQEERHRIAETLDTEIKRWAAGKEGNLRALLSTLQYVLWPECGWQPVSLTDLITGASVKKAYRKATLCIHPDKVQQKGATLQQKYIAEKVFDLLKEAWNKFNSEELF
ncbi:PREDICTED: auxilin-related protein 2-like [Ipomoea nil]|uniref:auxilin-related protein 2-like n=1 Tax=Ipomoea nil TaxID=35883 RepID=UPI0009017798|nr:PREDICTED: auxilin-related protein 2-like [Ipomoea nil]